MSSAEILRKHFELRYGLELGDPTPTEIVRVVHTSQPVEDDIAFEVRGRQPDGTWGTVMASRSEIRGILRETRP